MRNGVLLEKRRNSRRPAVAAAAAAAAAGHQLPLLPRLPHLQLPQPLLQRLQLRRRKNSSPGCAIAPNTDC
eukprot:SAG11_NODE_6300_length_1342_cov_1.309735_2_plen_71_part_00